MVIVEHWWDHHVYLAQVILSCLTFFVMMLNDVSLSCTMLFIDVLFMAYSNKVI